MNLKSLLVLVALAVGVGLYLEFGVIRPAEEKTASGDKESKIIKGDLSLLTALDYTAEGKSLQLEKPKDSKGWKITAPIRDIAAQPKVENLVSALERFKQTRVIQTADEIKNGKVDLAQYGLAPAKLVLHLKTADQKEPIQISTGDTNSDSTNVYAQVGKDGEVVLATMDLDFLKTQSVDDFREMRLVTVGQSDLAEVTIESKGKKTKFKRDEKDKWMMVEPYPGVALDPEMVESQIEKVALLRANAFLPKLPANASKHDVRILAGFKEGVRDARTTESDKRPEGTEILLSRAPKVAKAKKGPPEENDGDKFEYFAVSEKTPPASIARFHYDTFTKAPEEYVRKTFDGFLVSEVEKVTIHDKSTSSKLELQRKDAGFEVIGGANAGKKLPFSNVERALNKIRALRAQKFLEVTDKQLKEPFATTLTLQMKGGQTQVLSFQSTKDKTQLWYMADKQSLRYELPKDAISAKDFELQSLEKDLVKDAAKAAQGEPQPPAALNELLKSIPDIGNKEPAKSN